MVGFWIVVFLLALLALLKGADWLLDSAEKIGLASGLSPFVIGVVITGVGTSAPELISAIAAVWQGVSEVVVANAVGSNIANILLIVGFSAVLGRRLVVTKNLIDLDLPLLAASTVLFLGTVADQFISRGEALILLVGYGVYLAYSVKTSDRVVAPGAVAVEDFMHKPFWRRILEKAGGEVPPVQFRDFVRLLAGFAALALGAKYLIDALIEISADFEIAVGAMAVVAVAFGTSLPELLISAKAAWRKKSEIALGNIFGSNVFNILVVTGLPGLLGPLTVDGPTFAIGLPVVLMATFLFIVSGISKRIHGWEGMLYILIYGLFIAKIFQY